MFEFPSHRKAIQICSHSTEELKLWGEGKPSIIVCVKGGGGSGGWGGGSKLSAGIFLKGGKGLDASAAEISLQRIL